MHESVCPSCGEILERCDCDWRDIIVCADRTIRKLQAQRDYWHTASNLQRNEMIRLAEIIKSGTTSHLLHGAEALVGIYEDARQIVSRLKQAEARGDTQEGGI